MPDIMSTILTTGSILTGVVSRSLQKALLDPLISRGLDKASVTRELTRLVTEAVGRISEECRQWLVRDRGPLDEQFWQSEEVRKELWETLADWHNAERVPNFERLWEAYSEICLQSARIDRLSFDQAMEAFWREFLAAARDSDLLRELLRDKIIFHLEETVYPHEGKQMILEFCRTMALKLKKRHYLKFRPRELKDDLPEEKIRAEFLDYQSTRLSYCQLRDGRIDRDRDGPTIEGDGFLAHEKVIFFGPGGVGKTRFTCDLVQRQTVAIAEGAAKPLYLPLFLEALDFQGATHQDLAKLLETKVREGLDRGRYPDAKIRGFCRFLLREKRLFAVIDAFDQSRRGQEDFVYRLLTNDTLFGLCRTVISTRPYRLKQLLEGIEGQGGNGEEYRLIEIHPFGLKKELPAYLAPYYEKIGPLVRILDREKEELNLLQIPLFARLVKIMAAKGRFLPAGRLAKVSRAMVMQWFVDSVIEIQAEKDKTAQGTKQNYRRMRQKIGPLARISLAQGKFRIFPGEMALNILAEGGVNYLDLAERIEFIREEGGGFLEKILDYENFPSFSEPEHSFQHQFFQEFFAAEDLRRLSQGGEEEKVVMRDAMEKMGYLPEVGAFLAELVAEKGSVSVWKFWQDRLFAENSEDWVRTYALQVRDRLSANNFRKELQSLFDAEMQEETEDDMVRVPAGVFLRGSYENRSEMPVTLVYLDEFMIDRTPVTNEAFCRFLNRAGVSLKTWINLEGSLENERCRIQKKERSYVVKEGFAQHPVIYVSWHGAKIYAEWAGKRLPTEAEWEKAARGRSGRRYPWGNEFDQARCNIHESGHARTTQVKQFPSGRSPLDCLDMAGNVWEWCCDSYKDDSYRQDERRNFINIGKETDLKRLRGGSWGFFRDFARCAYRLGGNPTAGGNDVGFRCARTLK